MPESVTRVQQIMCHFARLSCCRSKYVAVVVCAYPHQQVFHALALAFACWGTYYIIHPNSLVDFTFACQFDCLFVCLLIFGWCVAHHGLHAPSSCSASD